MIVKKLINRTIGINGIGAQNVDLNLSVYNNLVNLIIQINTSTTISICKYERNDEQCCRICQEPRE